MFINLEGAQYFPRFTFFAKERKVNNEKIKKTDTQVFGVLSDGIKRTAEDGSISWNNDYWNAAFVGDAYLPALDLMDRDRIELKKFLIRNIYMKDSKKSFQIIYIYEFTMLEQSINGDEFVSALNNVIDQELPFH